MMESIRVVLVFCVLAIAASCARDFPLKPCKANSTCSCTNADGYYDLHPLANNNNTPQHKMKTFLLCCFGIFLVSASSRDPFSPPLLDQCDPDSTCSCTNSHGYIDLHPVANQDRTPHFTNVQDTRGIFLYSYNPCYGFDEGGSDCINAAVCQKDLQTGRYYAIGYANSMVSIADSEYGLIFQYTAQTDKNRTAEIILQCDPTKEGELEFQNEGPPLYYYFNLYSKYACAQQPSTSGSTHSPTPSHRIHSEPQPGHHSRPHMRPTPPQPGRHSRPPRPTKHHGHHSKPTQDPTTPAPLKIFGWPAVTILLLGILIMVTVLCGLIIFGLCLFTSKFSYSKTPGHKAELGQNVNSEYTKNSDKQLLKNDF